MVFNKEVVAISFLLSASQVVLGQSQYNNNCIGCIADNYAYSGTDCLPLVNATSTSYTSETGCPDQGYCSVGNAGFLFIGNTDLTTEQGGYGLDGSVTLEAPTNEPCIITLMNQQENVIEVTIAGASVETYILSMSEPNSVSYEIHDSGKYTIEEAQQMTKLYIGSTALTGDSTAIVSWQKYVATQSEPEAPTDNTFGFYSLTRNSVMASVCTVAIYMFSTVF